MPINTVRFSSFNRAVLTAVAVATLGLSLQACAPLVVGGVAATGVMVAVGSSRVGVAILTPAGTKAISSTGNKAALPQINPEIAGNKTIFVPEEYMPKMIQPGSFTNEAREAMAAAYNRFKQGS